MSLRTRIALLVGITVLVASAIGGIGTSISSRNIGQDRLDEELLSDAASLPVGNPRLAERLRTILNSRAVSCDDTDLAEFLDDDRPNNGRRVRFLPQFASVVQLVRTDGTTVSPCQELPTSDTELAIAQLGTGTNFRTVSIEEERFRVLTVGYGDAGAVQYARSLKITEDTLRSLLVRSIGFGLIGAICAAMLGWFFAGRATRPLKRLSATAHRVARTRDLGERIEVDGDKEVGALAGSFNTMLASLDTSRAQQRRLVQDASHELRTPLTSMRTNVELLQRHLDIDESIRQEVLGDISLELGELTELTVELVESATEVPTQVRTAAPVDFVEVVNTCVGRARRRHNRTIELNVSRDEDVDVTGDSALLGRAVTNLINNAVKFSPPDTTIEVEANATSVLVSDRGPGIDEADLPNIFDRFYRATAARSAPGSGLGLSIVKQIVEGHDGSVRASNRYGGGAEVGFSLPALQPPRTAQGD